MLARDMHEEAQVFAILRMAGFDVRLSSKDPSGGDSQGRDADVSDLVAPNAGQPRDISHITVAPPWCTGRGAGRRRRGLLPA
jgi:hypothetical protein